MLRDTTVYFVGKILNEKEDDDDNAETFRFSKTERASLAKQLRNIPVQLEHEDTLKVGQITNAFRDNNDQFWVFGKVNAKDFKGTFAKHSLQKKGTAGVDISIFSTLNSFGVGVGVGVEVSIIFKYSNVLLIN